MLISIFIEYWKAITTLEYLQNKTGNRTNFCVVSAFILDLALFSGRGVTTIGAAAKCQTFLFDYRYCWFCDQLPQSWHGTPYRMVAWRLSLWIYYSRSSDLWRCVVCWKQEQISVRKKTSCFWWLLVFSKRFRTKWFACRCLRYQQQFITPLPTRECRSCDNVYWRSRRICMSKTWTAMTTHISVHLLLNSQ